MFAGLLIPNIPRKGSGKHAAVRGHRLLQVLAPAAGTALPWRPLVPTSP